MVIRKAERLRGLLHPITRKSVAQLVRSMNSLQSIIGASPRTGQKLVGELLGQRLLISDSPKGRLRLEFPAEASGQCSGAARFAGWWMPAPRNCSPPGR